MSSKLITIQRPIIEKMKSEGRVQSLSIEESRELIAAMGDGFEKAMEEAEQELRESGITISISTDHYYE